MALKGLEQFEKTLKDLEKHVTGEVLRNALLSAVKPLILEASSTAPRARGKLASSITAQSMSYAAANEAIVRVGPGRPEGSHGIFLEFGTIYMTARPFLASAYEATLSQVLEEFESNVYEEAMNSILLGISGV